MHLRESGDRFWEIDTIRGIAVLMMITFHTVFAVNYLGIYRIVVSTGFWRLFALVTASLFIFLVGLSLAIRNSREVSTGRKAGSYRSYFMRGARIFAWGLLITVVSWFAVGDGFIRFGILHLIGASIIIAPFFFRFREFNLVVGAYVIVTGLIIPYFPGPIWLLWLGLHPYPFYSIDYVPLFPWFGLVLIGLYCGSLLYPGGVRRFRIPDLRTPITSLLTFCGRNSLIIYLIHVPVILLVLAIAFPEILISLSG
jgi:uncharacterized membrane protein